MFVIILVFLIMSSVPGITDDLAEFSDAVMAQVNAAALTYKMSGTARITKMGGGVLYSASLHHKDKNATIDTPENLSPIFQSLKVAGYQFRSLEVLTFLSTVNLPLPLWRVQIKYSKLS